LLELLEERTLLSPFTVMDNSDVPTDTESLRWGVNHEPSGTIINFASNVTSPITLINGPLDITTNLDIEGPGAGNLTISGNHKSTVFNVAKGVTATIAGLTVAYGSTRASGGPILNAGTLKVTNDVFNSNSASGVGGAICNSTSANLSVTGCSFTGNTSKAAGGGIYLASGMVTISGSTFESNAGPLGGGIFNEGGMLSLTDSTIANSTSSFGPGGGIYNVKSGGATLTNCTVTLNSAAGNGGGIENSATLSLVNCTVANNSAASNGGGIDNNGSATVGNTIVAGNHLTGEGGSGPDFSGAVTTDSGNNLIGNNSGSTGFNQPPDLLNVDPLLSSLGNYGGST